MKLSLFFAGVQVDFLSTTFSGLEGESVSVCIIITNGSVELFGFVNVELVATDITAIGMYRLWYRERCFMNCISPYSYHLSNSAYTISLCMYNCCLILPS